MASSSTSDVIELVSSDEDSEPAPKKIKPGKNAMVHIPDGVTIKPSSKAKPVMPIIREVVGRGITLTKIESLVEKPHINKNKPNGRQGQRPLVIRPTVVAKPLLNPVSVQGVNPLSLIKKLHNSQIRINKVTGNKHFLKHPVKLAQKPIQKTTVNNLPPSITVKRTSGGLKCPTIANVTHFQNKKLKIQSKPIVRQGEILTVELDDDEVAAPSTANPQWYLRPEQQTESSNIEVKNNAEPEPSKLIEITIEDSPVKPALTKRTCELGNELAITIEDSPVKPVADKTAASGSSDSENTTRNDVPSSKKKLEYPKENTVVLGADSIEIEIEPMEVTSSNKENDKKNNEEIVNTVIESIEIEESPLKTDVQQVSSTPKKDEHIGSQQRSIDIEETTQRNDGEFHPVYQTFIDLCFKLENSDDMKKIVDKKIKAYYRQVPKEYTESENFVDMVSCKIISMRASPEKMYLYIKDIVDELNLQRKMAKSQVINIETKNTEPESFLYGEDSEFDSKRQRQIRKLEKTLKKLHRAIQKLEEQEVDFDDEEDSVYLLTERYKERMIRVHAKFCQLTNTKMPSEPRVQIDARPGQPKGPAKRLEKWINRKVPIGTPLPFPDFHDVLRCVREANEEEKIGWNEADIMEEARDLFTRCGRKLQRRRQENEWRLAASRISHDVDPADGSESLKKRLEENKLLASKKETEVFNKYADRQSQLKLEAEEIGDKEAEESPVESEDDEANDDSSTLENKEKRKERLRRLIQEKSKKPVDGKVEKDEPENSQSDSEMIIDGDSKTENYKNESETKEIESQEKDMEIDTAMASNENEFKPKSIEKIHSISDDSNRVDSDVDELHLLQKLHSENDVNTSTLDSSDTDSPIDISDTLHSSSDNKGKTTSGVISIENSSYSESEVNKDLNNSIYDVMDSAAMGHGKELAEKTANADVEIEFEPTDNVEVKTAQINNDEYTDSVGNILLASSEDEDNECKVECSGSGNVSINLKDDAISIGDTEIQEVKKDTMNTLKNDDVVNAQSEGLGSVRICASLKDNTLSIGNKVIQKHNLKTNKMDTETNEASVVQDKSTGVDINVNPKNNGISIGDIKIQQVELHNDKIHIENNDEISSVLYTKKNNGTKSVDFDSTEKDSIVIAPIKRTDAVTIEKSKEPKNTDVVDVDMSIKSTMSLSGEGSESPNEAQKSSSPKIKETLRSATEQLVENASIVMKKLQEAKSTYNKDSLDTVTLSSESSKSAPDEETDPTANIVELVSGRMTNPDDSNKILESAKNDVINMVPDMAENNDNMLAASDNINNFLVADNSVDQSDSLEKVLKDLQSNLQSNEPSPIVEPVKNTG